VLQVRNKLPLLELSKLIRSRGQHGKADHNFATVLFRVRNRRALAVTCGVWPNVPVSWEEA
jgi:hypothetical protein